MFKNVASQKIQVFAFIPSTGLPKTGDAANITAYVSKDHGAVTVLGDTSATEMDATNAKGIYVFDLTQAETNADELTFSAKSATSDVSIVPRFIHTNPPNFTAASIDSNGRVDVIKIAGTTQTARDIGASVLLSTGTGTGQLDFTSGVVKANATQWLGGTIPAVNVTGVPLVDVKYLLGTIFATPATAGIPDINVKNINNVAAATPGAAGGVFIAGTNAATTVTTSFTTTFTGNLTGSVASVTGNVGGNVVGTVASVVGAVGSVTGLTASDVGAIKTKTDSLTFTAAAKVDANVLAINGDATSAANIAKTTRAIARGTVGSASSTTSIVTSAFTPAGAVADQFKGRIVTFDADTTTTALRGQSTDITASSNVSTPVLTVTALTTAPSSGDTFSVT